MQKTLNAVALFAIFFSTTLGLSKGQSSADQEAKILAEEAVLKARDGKLEIAIASLRKAVALSPRQESILRDFAVILGWAERYDEAIQIIGEVTSLEPEQPDWALKEFSRSYLFGGDPAAALRILDDLINREETSEPILLRRALALRWLGHPREAASAYETASLHYPSSGAARAGLAYSLADQNRLTAALRSANQGLATLPEDPELLKAKIRILNWMGRHLEAQRMLAAVPDPLSSDFEILEDRIAASRWGGDPVAAVAEARKLLDSQPQNAKVKKLASEVELEYGRSLTPGFRYASDSDGFVDRSSSVESSFHLTPAHRFSAGFQYRQFSQEGGDLIWRRYGLDWTGILSPHIRSFASTSDVNYGNGSSHRIIGDGGVSVRLSDAAAITASGGTIAMDAFRSVQNRVTATFASGELSLRPVQLARLEARYANYEFSDGVRRDRTDFSGMFQVRSQRRLTLRLGARTTLMWHDRGTSDFYSPEHFQSYLGAVEASGRMNRRLDYSLEALSGWQQEPGTSLQRPLQLVGRLVWHPSPWLRLVIDTGWTTSSLDRVSAYRSPYTRRFASLSLEYSHP